MNTESCCYPSNPSLSQIYIVRSFSPKMNKKKESILLARFGVLGELLQFLWQRKLWWLIPMIILVILFVVLLVFAQGSAVAPFIYTLF
jgi:hypothetical protein